MSTSVYKLQPPTWEGKLDEAKQNGGLTKTTSARYMYARIPYIVNAVLNEQGLQSLVWRAIEERKNRSKPLDIDNIKFEVSCLMRDQCNEIFAEDKELRSTFPNCDGLMDARTDERMEKGVQDAFNKWAVSLDPAPENSEITLWERVASFASMFKW